MSVTSREVEPEFEPPVAADVCEHPEDVVRAEPPTELAAATLVIGAAIALAIIGIQRSDIGDVDGIGLVGVLQPTYFVGVALVVIALAVAVGTGRLRIAWGAVVGLIILLHGLPGMLEPNPRFAVAWLHVGFADQIAADGELLPFLDARFSWPGFFASGGFLQRMSDTDSLLWMVRYAPIAINLVAVVLVWHLALALRSSRRQAVLAAGLFTIGNWVGQDYFAPQALGFLMSMFVLVLVLRRLPAAAPLTGWRHRLLRSPATSWTSARGVEAGVVYSIIVAVILALVVTHQLSPVFLGSTLLALAVVGRIVPKMLGFVVFVAMASWLSFGAEAYWLGHLDKLFGTAGQPDAVIDAGVANRAAGSSDERQIVLFARIAFAVGTWGLTLSVIAVRRLRHTLDPALLALLLGPFAAVVAQPYGGELLLRVAFFTLPVCAIVLAQAALATHAWWRTASIAVVLMALVPVFLMARFGNEAYEFISDDDLAVTQDLYDLAPDDSIVYVQNRQTLLSLDRIGDVRFRSIDAQLNAAETISEIRGVALDLDGQVYVLLTESQSIVGIETRGFPADWISDFADDLLDDPLVTVESRQGEAVLLSVGSTPAGPGDG